MQIYTPILLLVLSALHGHADAAPSIKSKRNNYDMLRLTRGLNMLRLGKRADQSTEDSQYEDVIQDYLQTLERISRELLQTPKDYEASSQDYYKTLMPVQDSYSHARYRRSTPSNSGMVTPAPPVDLSGDSFVDDAELKIDDDGLDRDEYFLYPELDDDGVIVDEEEGKVWDAKTGEALSEGEYDNDSSDTLTLGKKRNLNMLRLGKRQLNMLRLGKRNMNFLRLGKRQLNMLRLGKRQLNMLRLGKRQLNMLRLGKREDETAKRNLQMLRLGKREDEEVKRNLQMLRLGKREDEEVKRNLQMLRLGKREDEAVKRNLQMLRLGKREEAFPEKRNLNMLRLGKRSVENAQENKEE